MVGEQRAHDLDFMTGVTLHVREWGLVHVYPVNHDSSVATSLGRPGLGLRVNVLPLCSQSFLLMAGYLEDMDFPTFSAISG